MKSERKFFLNQFHLNVLSEDKMFTSNDLRRIADEMDNGDLVGQLTQDESLSIEPDNMADMLYNFGSEPAFFRLNDDGSDTED